MKLRHWVNIIVILFSASALTWLALQWAITSYVEPTCQRYAATKRFTYVSYTPLDPTITSSHTVHEGDCQMRDSSGQPQVVSLLKASGTSYGAPLFISLALNWHLVFIASFFVAALTLAMLYRVITGKAAS